MGAVLGPARPVPPPYLPPHITKSKGLNNGQNDWET